MRENQGNAWIAESNAYAYRVFDVARRFEPESLSQVGDCSADEAVFELPVDLAAEQNAAYGEVVAGFRRELTNPCLDPRVRSDLGILIGHLDREIEHRRLEDALTLPYVNLAQTIFNGIRVLLNDKTEPHRRQAARVRLDRYSGAQGDQPPVAEQFADRLRSRLNRLGLVPPCKERVARDLQASPIYLRDLGELLKRFGIPGWERSYARLGEQLRRCDALVRERVLPRARERYRLPDELYVSHLLLNGVEMSAGELVSRARVDLKRTLREMQALARHLGGEGSVLLKVLRELGRQRIPGERIVSHYQERMRELRELIQGRGILTLPELDLRVVAATAAESARMPFPHVPFPPMIGSRREPIEIILPLVYSANGAEISGAMDAGSESASWTVAAHEASHAIQFAALRGDGVPLARSLFGSMSECEGWAVYLETELMGDLPPAARMISLRSHLLRCARTILEVEIQQDLRSPAQAERVLRDEVGLTAAAVRQEILRFLLMPGQAPSPLYGYIRHLELLAEAELALGRRFHRRQYHDFLLTQGLSPLPLLRRRVLGEFVDRPRPPRNDATRSFRAGPRAAG